ncbi:hypothetical protein EV702DRAFT_1202769 [Suillus placidus]|uniref:Uncharacterized protein n=1 Tax=Suillus placidus TaxID=48579 RepID=A0A9P6ZM41_9AGAM|nr:hypothetical protein EV702DRAFT_1202769 [Suillus placidus]
MTKPYYRVGFAFLGEVTFSSSQQDVWKAAIHHAPELPAAYSFISFQTYALSPRTRFCSRDQPRDPLDVCVFTLYLVILAIDSTIILMFAAASQLLSLATTQTHSDSRPSSGIDIDAKSDKDTPPTSDPIPIDVDVLSDDEDAPSVKMSANHERSSSGASSCSKSSKSAASVDQSGEESDAPTTKSAKPKRPPLKKSGAAGGETGSGSGLGENTMFLTKAEQRAQEKKIEKKATENSFFLVDVPDVSDPNNFVPRRCIALFFDASFIYGVEAFSNAYMLIISTDLGGSL